MFQISLEAARVNAKMTQQDVSSVLNVSRATISSWGNGVSSPSISQFINLCKVYECPIDIISIPQDRTENTNE